MATQRLSRRAVLRGAGSLAIALPWLEIMGEPRRASAQSAAPATRFLAVYTPGGTVGDKFWLDMKSAIGEQHQAGIVAWLTGTPQSNSHRQYASGPSIDQVIATRVAGDRKKRSLELAVRWADTPVVCAAHSAVRKLGQGGFREEMEAALAGVERTLARHRNRFD